MIVSVFGASGRTGRAFVAAASATGMPLRLHYRSAPDDIAPERSTVVVGALKDPIVVREVLRGADAVVILFGPRPNTRDNIFCATATRAILDGMRTQSPQRVLCVTGAMMGTLSHNLSLRMRITALWQRRTGNEELTDDRAEQERLVRSSRLEWTVVKPPALTDSTAPEEVNAATDLKVGPESQISRLSLAQSLLTELHERRFVHKDMYVRATGPYRS